MTEAKDKRNWFKCHQFTILAVAMSLVVLLVCGGMFVLYQFVDDLNHNKADVLSLRTTNCNIRRATLVAAAGADATKSASSRDRAAQFRAFANFYSPSVCNGIPEPRDGLNPFGTPSRGR
jgi:hypothetical protein